MNRIKLIKRTQFCDRNEKNKNKFKLNENSLCLKTQTQLQEKLCKE